MRFYRGNSKGDPKPMENRFVGHVAWASEACSKNVYAPFFALLHVLVVVGGNEKVNP